METVHNEVCHSYNWSERTDGRSRDERPVADRPSNTLFSACFSAERPEAAGRPATSTTSCRHNGGIPQLPSAQGQTLARGQFAPAAHALTLTRSILAPFPDAEKRSATRRMRDATSATRTISGDGASAISRRCQNGQRLSQNIGRSSLRIRT